jgi:pimeloyl-ACP methyl ester carboxylesterase
VLLAGLGGKGQSFQPFLRRAALERSVLTFDHRGAGDAAPAPAALTLRLLAEDALLLLDALGLERTPLVGRSMGGMVAQELALLAPERVSALVLVSTTARVDAHLAQIFELWARMAEAKVPPEIRHRSSLLWCLGARSLAQGGAARAYLRARGAHDRPDDYAIQARACARHDALERLGTLRMPALVVAGDDDRLMPSVHAETLAKALPSARIAWIPGAGHLAYLEAPDAFASEVLAFLRATESDPRARSGERV